jgi:RNA polymerase sigma factor (sigma-70 family)
MRIGDKEMRSELNDQELLLLYKESADISLAAVLFSRYTHLVFGLCMKYLKDEEDSRDAVMTIFEKLIEDLKKHEISNFKSWLYSVSKNHCLMVLRKKTSENEKIPDLLMKNEYVLHLSSEEDKELNLLKLDNCMEKLVEQQRKCIELFFLQEKCYREIEANTGYSSNEVKSFIQNGKRNLKNCMERSTDD